MLFFCQFLLVKTIIKFLLLLISTLFTKLNPVLSRTLISLIFNIDTYYFFGLALNIFWYSLLSKLISWTALFYTFIHLVCTAYLLLTIPIVSN